MYDIVQVVNAILSKQSMTHKKLQKICYYFYSWYWVIYNEKIFDDSFEAWVHGPVSPSLYKKYKSFGWKEIKIEEENNCFMVKDDKFLDKILEIYGKYSADELEDLTHKELPWQNARRGLDKFENCNSVIDINDIRYFYENQTDIKKLLQN
ncbi:MAG TPA: hypothetical protein DCW51_07150 [Clostridium sp.]|nr:hypothetical protein [Clostridium sp.]